METEDLNNNKKKPKKNKRVFLWKTEDPKYTVYIHTYIVVHADSLKPFKTSVPGAADLYRDDDNNNMTGGEELHGDGETSQKLRIKQYPMTNQNELLATKLVLTTRKFPFSRQRA